MFWAWMAKYSSSNCFNSWSAIVIYEGEVEMSILIMLYLGKIISNLNFKFNFSHSIQINWLFTKKNFSVNNLFNDVW